jgi:hypothetical protein
VPFSQSFETFAVKISAQIKNPALLERGQVWKIEKFA